MSPRLRSNGIDGCPAPGPRATMCHSHWRESCYHQDVCVHAWAPSSRAGYCCSAAPAELRRTIGGRRAWSTARVQQADKPIRARLVEPRRTAVQAAQAAQAAQAEASTLEGAPRWRTRKMAPRAETARRFARSTSRFRSNAAEPRPIAVPAASVRRRASLPVAAQTCQPCGSANRTRIVRWARSAFRNPLSLAPQARPRHARLPAPRARARRISVAARTDAASPSLATRGSTVAPDGSAIPARRAQTSAAAEQSAARARATRAPMTASVIPSGMAAMPTGARRSCVATAAGRAPTAWSAALRHAQTRMAAVVRPMPPAASIASAALRATAPPDLVNWTMIASAEFVSAGSAPRTSTIARG